MTRTKRTIEIWDKCECGKTLHSISEGERGICCTCWVKSMPADTKKSLNRLIAAAFKPTSEDEKNKLIDEAIDKLNRDKINV